MCVLRILPCWLEMGLGDGGSANLTAKVICTNKVSLLLCSVWSIAQNLNWRMLMLN